MARPDATALRSGSTEGLGDLNWAWRRKRDGNEKGERVTETYSWVTNSGEQEEKTVIGEWRVGRGN